jgi:hypothetical protein
MSIKASCPGGLRAGAVLLAATAVLVLCWALVSCRQPEPDRSYLDGVPCAAPCWQDITPGRTAEKDAISILSNPDLIDQDTLDCRSIVRNPLGTICTFWRSSNEGGNVRFEGEAVSGIRLKSSFELGEMIAAFGPPDFVNAMYGAQLANEGKCYRADVYYLKGIRLLVSGCKPIDFPLEIISNSNLVLFEEMQAIGLDFTPPSQELDAFLLTLFEDLGVARSDLVNARPWKGYGEYPLPHEP